MLENNEVTEEVTQPTEEQFDVDSFVDSIIQLNNDLEQSFKEDTEKTFVKMIVQRLLNFGLKKSNIGQKLKETSKQGAYCFTKVMSLCLSVCVCVCVCVCV